MQRLKLKRIKKEADKPRLFNVKFYKILNHQRFEISVDEQDRLIIQNCKNGKIYELINVIEG